MNNPNTHRLPEPNPVTQGRHHRQVWWQVLFPVLLAAIAIIALIFLTATAPTTTVSQYSNISIIFLILPTAVATLVVFILLCALIFLLARLLRVMPRYTRLAQQTLDKVTAALKRVSDKAASPVISFESVMAGLQTLVNRRKNAQVPNQPGEHV